jgi:multiple sugar transport system ATP-binding protein
MNLTVSAKNERPKIATLKAGNRSFGGKIMGSVQIRNVSKSFGALDVIRDVSIDIADGEFLVLVGPSGCGKSTLLRIISGLDPLTGGEIRIDGKDVTDLPAKARDIAMVFQSYALYPHMTVAENMGFSLRLRGESNAVTAERVKAVAATLGLTDYLARKPAALSGGQRQRVAMGRAIVRDPKVFLFDEPLSNLDAKLRVQMRTEIKALHQRLKTTTVYVTHDQVEALTMADRIVVLRSGVIEQIGTPIELFDRPVNTFVAEFIGSPSMNLFAGRVEGARVVLDRGGVVEQQTKAVEGQRVLIGIRPDHFALSEAAEAIRGTVEVVESLGTQMQIGLRDGEATFNAILNERLATSPGATLGFVPRPGMVHLFDAETGLRLGA